MRKFYLLFMMLVMALVGSAQGLEKVAEANTDFEGVESINVQGDFCKVSFIKGEKVNVSAELMANKALDGYDVSMDVVDGVLSVEIKKPESGWSSHSGFVSVTMPDGLNIDVLTSSGYISMEGFRNTNLKAETKSGKITVSDLVGDAKLKTKSASITVSNVTGDVSTSSKAGSQSINSVKGTARIISYSGELIIEGVEGNCSAETTDGALTMKNIKGEITLKSNSGALKLSDAEGTITAMSGAGSLNFFNAIGVFDVTSGKGDVIGTRIKFTASSTFKTTEGKIKLKLDHNKEELSFMCESEKGMMVAYGKAKKKKLKLDGGPILITTYSTTGAQNFY